MAKQKKNTVVENEVDSFSGINSLLDSIGSYGSLMSNEDYVTIKDWISTGNYALNAVISGDIFKGIPSGRITQFAGESQSGKSYVALKVAKNAIDNGYSVVWLDSENAIDRNQLLLMGIDVSKFRHQLVNTIFEVTFIVKSICKEILTAKENGNPVPKILIVLDSIGNLASDKETGDVTDGDNKVDMTRPKEIKKLYRVLTPDVAKTHIPLLIINHVYANTGSFIGGNIVSGGSGNAYLSSVTVEFVKAQLKEGDSRVGTLVTAKLLKGRFSTVGAKKKFHIHFKKGINPYIGLQTFLNDEIYEKCGIGVGKLNKDGSFVSNPKDDLGLTGYVIDGKSVKMKDFFIKSTFTKERLDVINEQVKKELGFGMTGEEEESEFEDLIKITNDLEDSNNGE